MIVLSAWREEGENHRFGQSEQREQSELAHYAESREIEDKRSAVNSPPATKQRIGPILCFLLSPPRAPYNPYNPYNPYIPYYRCASTTLSSLRPTTLL